MYIAFSRNVNPRTFIGLLLFVYLCGITLFSMAHADGGISIQGTRIIYPEGKKQMSIILNNTSQTDTFLVQSWVATPDGQKTKDFVVTPPLYVSGPGNGNTLRLIYTGGPLAQDHESLYYFVAKAIPSVDKKASEGQNMLILAAANRIKLFVRPSGLTPDVGKAPEKLTFRKTGGQLEISNPTPYYLTLTEMKAGGRTLPGIMVPPEGTTRIDHPGGSNVTFRTINDAGALTPVLTKTIQ